MTLRQKLLASYLVFVATLALLGVWSAWRLNQAGNVSARILSENYESVIAAQNMMESLERQDSAALFARLGHAERAERQIAENRERFNRAFARAAGNVTETGEQDIIDAIRHTREAYYRATDERADYFSSLEPLFNRLRTDLDRLLHLNQEAMLTKSANAQRVTHRALAMTVALAGTLVALGFTLAFTLSSRIHHDADRLKSEFVGTASHELRTPLTTLQMGIQLLTSNLLVTPPTGSVKFSTCAAKMRRGSSGSSTDLLDLSKMASGHMRPDLGAMPAATLVRDSLRRQPSPESTGLSSSWRSMSTTNCRRSWPTRDRSSASCRI